MPSDAVRELKPCPFCGGGAVISADMTPTPDAACDACGASVSGDGVDGAVAAWNRRAPLSLSDAVEAVGLAMPHATLAEVNTASLDVQEFAQQEKIRRDE